MVDPRALALRDTLPWPWWGTGQPSLQEIPWNPWVAAAAFGGLETVGTSRVLTDGAGCEETARDAVEQHEAKEMASVVVRHGDVMRTEACRAPGPCWTRAMVVVVEVADPTSAAWAAMDTRTVVPARADQLGEMAGAASYRAECLVACPEWQAIVQWQLGDVMAGGNRNDRQSWEPGETTWAAARPDSPSRLRTSEGIAWVETRMDDSSRAARAATGPMPIPLAALNRNHQCPFGGIHVARSRFC